MHITQLDEQLPILGSGSHKRSPGLHLTEVIDDLMQTSGIAKKYDNQWDFRTTITAGFVFEEALKLLLRDAGIIFHLGEFEHDGIYCTPDGVKLNGELLLVEIKWTWRSSKLDPADEFRWLAQIKGYCKVLGLGKANLKVYHVNGDYSYKTGPEYRSYLLEFQPHEIEENWTMLRNHAEYMRKRDDN